MQRPLGSCGTQIYKPNLDNEFNQASEIWANVLSKLSFQRIRKGISPPAQFQNCSLTLPTIEWIKNQNSQKVLNQLINVRMLNSLCFTEPVQTQGSEGLHFSSRKISQIIQSIH